uniref:Uncharacterized protein n=1 Tax=Rhabditophanes sp. KR3021 TaxID=114890 RepID=A0AC35TUX7_9BILA
MKALLILILLLNLTSQSFCQYRSFSDSKFDLPSHLPSEDPIFSFQDDAGNFVKPSHQYDVKKAHGSNILKQELQKINKIKQIVPQLPLFVQKVQEPSAPIMIQSPVMVPSSATSRIKPAIFARPVYLPSNLNLQQNVRLQGSRENTKSSEEHFRIPVQSNQQQNIQPQVNQQQNIPSQVNQQQNIPSQVNQQQNIQPQVSQQNGQTQINRQNSQPQATQQQTINSQQSIPVPQLVRPSGTQYLPTLVEIPPVLELNGIPQTPQIGRENDMQSIPSSPLFGPIPLPQPAPIASAFFGSSVDDAPEQISPSGERIILPQAPTASSYEAKAKAATTSFNPPQNDSPKISISPAPQIIHQNKDVLDLSDSTSGPTTFDQSTLFFEETYKLDECPRDSRYIADLFYQKFPKNLLKNGKEIELINLLGPRIEQCYLKKEKKHWVKVETFFGKLGLSIEKENSCRSGLIQEQIACMNLLSYSCQFVQHTFAFKLAPARLTIQEARQAEAGENQCKEVVKEIKKILINGKRQ